MVGYLASIGTAGNSPDVLRFLRALRRRKFLALGTAVTVFAGVAAYTYTRVPIYESETLILIANRTSLPIVQTTDRAEEPTDLETEILILKSRPVMVRALKQLTPPDRTITAEQVMGNMAILPIANAGVLKVSYRDTDPARAQAVLSAIGETYVDYSLSSKRSQATNAIKFIEAQLPEAKRSLNNSAVAIREFRKRHNITDPDSYAAATSGGLQALKQRVQDLQITLKQSQRQYGELRRQVGDEPQVALATAVLSQDPNYQRLITLYKEAETAYVLERARFKEAHPTVKALRVRRDKYLQLLEAQARGVLGNQNATASVSAPPTEASPSLSELPQEPLQADGLVQLKPSLEPLASTPRPTAAQIPQYQSLQQGLVTGLLSAQTNLSVQTVQLEALRVAEAEMARRFSQIPGLQQQYTEFQRQFAVNSESLNGLLTKLQELRISEAQETSPWRILEPPYRPGDPISPKTNQNLLYGLIASVLLGVGAALGRDFLDQRVQNVQEAKELTRLPVLGVIPKHEEQTESLRTSPTGQYHRSAFKDSLRSLALGLRYLGSDKSVKTLLLTSSIASEGKSTITYNLGLVLAGFGSRVLLVDADLRKPNLHALADLPNTVGLSTAIATDTPWQELIQCENDNMDVLTSGPLPPDPVTLLASEKMKYLLGEWRQLYDYVLIDTPPTVGLPDVQSLAAHVDRVLLVLALERSVRSLISGALETLQASQARVAGVVVNLLKKGDQGYYPYYSPYERTDNASSRGRQLLNGLLRR